MVPCEMKVFILYSSAQFLRLKHLSALVFKRATGVDTNGNLHSFTPLENRFVIRFVIIHLPQL